MQVHKSAKYITALVFFGYLNENILLLVSLIIIIEDLHVKEDRVLGPHQLHNYYGPTVVIP